MDIGVPSPHLFANIAATVYRQREIRTLKP
jgi:hypothetical protein